MRKVLFLLLFVNYFGFAQYGVDWGFKAGIGYSDGLYMDLSATKIYIDDSGGMFPLGIHEIGVGLEYIKIKEDNLYGANLNYEYSYLFLLGGLDLEYLTNDRFLEENEVNIKPRLGLTIFSVMTLSYSYSIHIGGNTDFGNYSRHGVKFEMILPLFMGEDSKYKKRNSMIK